MSGYVLKNISCLVTCNDRDEIVSGVDLVIRDRQIEAIGENLAAANPELEVMDCQGCLVGPGLVNTHHHFYQTMFRGIPEAQGLALFDWLKTLYRYWQHMTPDVVYQGTRTALIELIRTGCTMTTDHHYVFPAGQKENPIEIQIGAARELGMRFHPTRGSMSLSEKDGGLPPESVVQTDHEILEDSARLVEAFHDPEPYAMTRIALAPCSPFSVTLDLMRRTAELAREKKVMLHTHVAETVDEEQYCMDTHGMRPVDLMESLGWMGQDVWYAHAIHLNDDEVARMAASGTGIAHCPSSNMKLGSGICRVTRILEQKGKIGLAVDGSASNDGSNLWQEMKRAYLLNHLFYGQRGLSAYQAFRLATRGGAEVLGRTDTGYLAPGMAADLIVISLEDPAFAGCHDPLTAVVNCGSSDLVDTVFINGKRVVHNRILLGVDLREAYSSAHRAARDCVAKNTSAGN